jgi:hypothetical protein
MGYLNHNRIIIMPTKQRKGEFAFISGCHITKLVKDVYQVYNDESEYSDSAGRTIKLGRCERDAYGNPVQFATIQNAELWVQGGKVIHPKVQYGVYKEDARQENEENQ